jgi:hypothetical protein
MAALMLGVVAIGMALFSDFDLVRHDRLRPIVVGTWMVATGVGMLRGANWARWSFYLWCAGSLLMAVLEARRISLGGYLIIASLYVVSNRTARDYFGPVNSIGRVW